MSMFHELMMRKKEEIMYATIKGTLTENNGVFSGFSNTNYLQTQQNFDVSQTNWEFVIKASKASTGNARLFCINNGNGAMHTIFSLTSFSCTILTTTLTISQNFTADNFYFFKIKRNGNILSLSWSSDGIIYQDEQSAEVTNWGNSGYVFYGRVAGLSTAGFGGTIDLNNSYIKLGSTKNKLQAVVGYTVVGSPTITDGVVSGFSSSDYLQLPNFPTLDNNSKVEIYIESKFYDNSVNYAVLSAYNGDTYDIKIMLDAGKRLYGYVYNNANSTRYFARLWCSELTPTSLLYTKYTIQNNLLKLARKIDLLNWFETEVSLTENFSYTKSTPLCIGRSLNGEIYIKNTYIKINNKLWFNGQQA